MIHPALQSLSQLCGDRAFLSTLSHTGGSSTLRPVSIPLCGCGTLALLSHCLLSSSLGSFKIPIPFSSDCPALHGSTPFLIHLRLYESSLLSFIHCYLLSFCQSYYSKPVLLFLYLACWTLLEGSRRHVDQGHRRHMVSPSSYFQLASCICSLRSFSTYL